MFTQNVLFKHVYETILSIETTRLHECAYMSNLLMKLELFTSFQLILNVENKIEH